MIRSRLFRRSPQHRPLYASVIEAGCGEKIKVYKAADRDNIGLTQFLFTAPCPVALTRAHGAGICAALG